MNFITVDSWDDQLWQDASPLYMEAFGDKGAKPLKVIKNMFAQGIAELHVAYRESTAIGMALTGKLARERIVIIDYLAIAPKEQSHGLGKSFVDYLKQKAKDEGYGRIIIEAEAEETADNSRRIHFWQSCGFHLTEYVHHYIWVPEPYLAMHLPLRADLKKITGEELFVYFNLFHQLSFRRFS
ncbi:N-acetyltransferase [Planomicrobium sp. CPCC 101079]|uniref:GNAT family N-acetyltransferase n=1 Tax=Planomicrobium sp. CPCC 101079 TaxID=2599618 RepID=UPI0011B3A7A0|nr:GNAT family N-acetyltransferase [Planomicrobium sp. CPCC 101079]TWT09324.1 GNAT family N-acetyltransferase [Planomicrobium sp. CPCC 101079]